MMNVLLILSLWYKSMSDIFFAKSEKNGIAKETIEKHTQRVVNECRKLKNEINNRMISDDIWNISEIACWLHDLGKYNKEFQKKLELNIKSIHGEIPHAFLSTGYIPENIDDTDFFPLFYSIAFHHERSVNFREENFNNVFEKDLKSKLKFLDWIQLNSNDNVNEIFYRNYYNYLDKNKSQYLNLFEERTEKQRLNKKKYIYIKGILHKCDYAASAHIEAEKEYVGKYEEHFKDGLKKKGITKLYDYQERAEKYRDKSIIFIASTGAGKTEYSMNWINGEKSFYLLGLRTAVDAMYGRFKEMFTGSNVALLHGESIYRLLEDKDKGDYEDDIFKYHTKTRQLSMPITVATADQLVPSVFKFPGFEFYYFTASYSKIVIDEIQSFAPEAIASIVVFLKEIENLGGKFLLMTATLPPFVIEEFKELEGSGKLVRDEHFSSMKRHRIKFVEEAILTGSAEEIIDEGLKSDKKILVISNTVAGAQKLYDAFVEYDPELLHSRFIRNDRKEKEDKIFNETNYKEYPENKNRVALWISTQIVEASLDIDFDILITENATIDALFQRFGRCYRNREYGSSEPNIYIFEPEDERINSLIYDKDITKNTWNALKKFDNMFITEEDKQSIIEEVFSNIENTKYYEKYKEYKKMLMLGLKADSKRDAIGNLFRNITNNYTVIPEPVFKDNKETIEKFFIDVEGNNLGAEKRYELKKELYGYTVPVQIFRNRKELLDDIIINGANPRKLDIYLLKGVTYNAQRGVEFIEGYKDKSNFIL